MWRLVSNSLSTRANLVRKGVLVSDSCSVCGVPKTREHLLFDFPWTQHLWMLFLGEQVTPSDCPSVDDWLSRWTTTTTRRREQNWRICMLICWQIWKTGCQLVYEYRLPNLDNVAREIAKASMEMNPAHQTEVRLPMTTSV